MARITSPSAPGGQTAPARTATNHWVLLITLTLALVYGLAASAIELVSRLSVPPPQEFALVTFAQGTPYNDALDAVMGLGLRIYVTTCVEGAIRFGDTHWSLARNLQYPESIFANEQYLGVATTPLTPADWLARVTALPDVTKVQTDPMWYCPEISGGGLVGRIQMAPPAPRPAALQFAASVAYGDALRVAAEHGLRLTDPCYEAAVAQGKHPTWHSESQQASFARNHALTVAPTILTPNDWLLHLPLDVTPGPAVANCP